MIPRKSIKRGKVVLKDKRGEGFGGVVYEVVLKHPKLDKYFTIMEKEPHYEGYHHAWATNLRFFKKQGFNVPDCYCKGGSLWLPDLLDHGQLFELDHVIRGYEKVENFESLLIQFARELGFLHNLGFVSTDRGGHAPFRCWFVIKSPEEEKLILLDVSHVKISKSKLMESRNIKALSNLVEDSGLNNYLLHQYLQGRSIFPDFSIPTPTHYFS